MTCNYPVLSPLVAPWMEKLLANNEQIARLIQEFGSPLNILCSSPFEENAFAFREVLQRHVIKSEIFYARKPNKAKEFVSAANRIKIGIDTASIDELKETLLIENDPDKVILTSVVLNEELVGIAVDSNILIVAENLDHLRLIQSVAKEKGKIQRLAIRFTNFFNNFQVRESRIGFDFAEAAGLWEILNGGYLNNLEVVGYHFHLNGYSTLQRSDALAKLLRFIEVNPDLHEKLKFVDIGGGFPVRYLKSREEWERFFSDLEKSLLGENPPITYLNDGLGVLPCNGQLLGEFNVYPYFCEVCKEQCLEQILLTQLDDEGSIAEKLNKLGLELRIEPGRALLDQCGITLARVAHRKVDRKGDIFVGLEMNMTQLMSSSADFLVDPLIVDLANVHKLPAVSEGKNGIFFAGTYCMDRDLILKRKVPVEKVPEVGDVVCFINTAAYMMHFLRSTGHSFHHARSIVIDDNSGSFIEELC